MLFAELTRQTADLSAKSRFLTRRPLRVRQRLSRGTSGAISVLGILFCSLWLDHANYADPIDTVRVDWAYYNPISLVLKNKHWLEDDLASSGIKVEWVQSLGSNKALEFLRGKSIDFGSTAGAAAFIGRANGNPIKAIYVYSAPEWTALVTGPKSGITRIEDLRGKRVAVARGTDPHIFLLRSLASVGLSENDIQVVPLQHPDGKVALERGQVDAWAGLDPYMAQLEIEKGFKLFFRQPGWNSFGVLNVREAFAAEHPDITESVLRAYEKARLWCLGHSDEARNILQSEAQLSPAVAEKVWERTSLKDPRLGSAQRQVIVESANALKSNGIIDPNTNVEEIVTELLDSSFADRIATAK
ncbi:MAG: aliphatic sulfonate ABC transporter substrate-binding protein [Verrucomicrobia bacterium]|nr:aliphatic sulfonate ABC transporter substrate-binding protein [Verrucomicrobiota bacterium]